MVVFTCNHCGDSLKKPKVAIHYQQMCRNAPFLTCVDCLKDFRGEEYVAHTKCITEAERYGAKDYVPKPGTNKGERKQQEWINVVNNLLNGTTDLSKAERSFLNSLSKYDNVPRKKAKFLNFVHSAIGNRVNAMVVESVWNKMENAHKQQVATKTPEKDATQNQKQNKDETMCGQNVDSNNSFDNQNIAENQNNENIHKENKSASYQNRNDKTCETTNGYLCERRNKSKKRRLESIDIQSSEEAQTAAKIIKQSVSETSNNESNGAKFHWKKTILGILQTKDELPLRKLQNKVMKKYIYHVFSLNEDTFKLTEYAKAVAKFNKTVEKLKELSAISILENKVKLL